MTSLIGSSGDDTIVAPKAGDIVDVASSSNGASGYNSDYTGADQYISFSPNGGEVAFDIFGGNLVSGVDAQTDEVYVKNLATGAISEIASPVSADYGVSSALFSRDGNSVYFHDNANGQLDEKNLNTGAITLVSATSAGGLADANTYATAVVGNRLFFASAADNLISGVSGMEWREYFENLDTGAITLIPNTGGLSEPVISANGSTLAYLSGPDSNQQVYVMNLATGASVLASTSNSGVVANSYCSSVALSPDGTEVVFSTFATNLGSDTNNVQQLYLKNLVTGAVTLLSANASGNAGDEGAFDAAFSPDGGEIAFTSYASNLVAGDDNGDMDVFVKNLATGTISLVSTGAGGQQGEGFIQDLSFSPDGSQIAFQDPGALTPGASLSDMNVYVKDLTGAANLTGGAGADTFVFAPGDGQDTVTDFSQAQGDKLDFSAFGFTTLAQALVDASQQGANTVFNLGGGATVTLLNVEMSALAKAPVADSFTGGPSSDVAFRDPTTGDFGYMTTTGGTEVWHPLGPTSTAYSIAGEGDFNGDGITDVAFRNAATGDWGYMAQNASGAGEAWHAIGPSGAGYAVIGAGDFNGDGVADLAFRNTSDGTWGYMALNRSGAGEAWTPVTGTAGLTYSAVGVADFNGDGKADIAFRDNSTGDFGYMSLDAQNVETWHPIGPTGVGYAAVGVGDFNGDGVQDVAFRNATTGDLGYMSVNPTGGETWHAMGPTSTAYAVAGVGDYGGDGLASVAFRNAATGDFGYMSANAVAGETWHPLGPTGTTYQAV